jgi:hypothetical protein
MKHDYSTLTERQYYQADADGHTAAMLAKR